MGDAIFFVNPNFPILPHSQSLIWFVTCIFIFFLRFCVLNDVQNVNRFQPIPVQFWRIGSKLYLGCARWIIYENLNHSNNCRGQMSKFIRLWKRRSSIIQVHSIASYCQLKKPIRACSHMCNCQPHYGCANDSRYIQNCCILYGYISCVYTYIYGHKCQI